MSDYVGSVRQPSGFPGLPQGWTSHAELWPGYDAQAQLFVAKHSSPTGGPRVLVVVHGLGEHGGRYLHVPHYVKDVVDHVYCIDQRGHGRSQGLRGHVERFDVFADDVASTVREVELRTRRAHGDAQIHLLGHSLGGHVAIRTLFAHPDLPLRSASISAPFLKIKVTVPVVKKVAAEVLRFVWPSLQLTTELDAAVLSHDPAVAQAYIVDRLVHGKMTPRFFATMQEAFKDTLSRTDGIRVPTQFMVPMQDKLVDPETTLEFFRGLKSRDKNLKTYPHLYHEILNEVDKAAVFADLVEWIRAH